MMPGRNIRSATRTIVVLSAMGLLTACSGEGVVEAPAPLPSITVGGSVAGLAGGSVALSLNSTELLTVPTSGAFTFAAQQAPGAAWSVAITRAPMAQNCSLANGNGVAQGQPVTGVAVTCALRSWRATESFGAPAGEHQQHPQVAIDGQGTAFVVAKELTGALSYAGRLQIAERATNGVWTPVGTGYLDASAGSNSNYVFGYDLAAAANGQAFVIWGEVQPSDFHYVFVSRRTGVGQWSSPARLDTNQAPSQYTTPQVAVSADGTAIAVWVGYDLQNQGMSAYASRYQSGTGWSAPERLESDLRALQEPQVAMDANGNAVVVWSKGGGGQNDEIWAAVYRNGTGWSPPVQLDNGNPARGESPRIAMDANGAAIAVWKRYNFNSANSSVMATRFTLAGGWNTTPIELISESLDQPGITGIAMNAAGHAFVAIDHLTMPGFAWSTRAVRFTPAGGWEAPIVLATGTYHSRVAVDPDGNATVVYASGGSDASLQTRRYIAATPGAGWQPVEDNVDGLESGSAQDPQISAGPDGSAMVVFSQVTNISPTLRTPHAVRLD